MKNVLRHFFRAIRKRRYAYRPLVEIRVSRSALLHNLHAFAALDPAVRVAPVVKSNAYGHGLATVAGVIADESVPFICVDSHFEALTLRTESIATPLLIIGYTPVENVLSSNVRDAAFGVIGLAQLRELSARARTTVRIHLKIDTGMHRHGILPRELADAVALIGKNTNIVCEGLYTHFADADTRGSAHAKGQIEIWNRIVREFKKKNAELPVKYFHCAATSGSYFTGDIEGNVMRLGIGLYGIPSGFAPVELRPVLEMRSVITSIRAIPSGESVGYNATFTTQKEMRVATVAAGYYEGIDRRLSNKGFFLVRGIPCPILGRVSMNITSFDVSNVPDAKDGEEVVLISNKKDDPNSIENVARTCGTIPYEIMVHLPPHLRRIII